jgi:hypothetical protein
METDNIAGGSHRHWEAYALAYRAVRVSHLGASGVLADRHPTGLELDQGRDGNALWEVEQLEVLPGTAGDVCSPSS